MVTRAPMSTITFDDLSVRAYVLRYRRTALVRPMQAGWPPLGALRRINGRCATLLWEPNEAYDVPPKCPLEVFATVATMI